MRKAFPTIDFASREETRAFLCAIFAPRDLVERRLIKTWMDAGARKSEVVGRGWATPESLMSDWYKLNRQNLGGANIHFGVNPRRSVGGSKKEDVALCRTLWADIDGARPDNDSIWQALPKPTLIIDSGHGLHLYWRLKTPVLLDTSASREFVETVLRGMYLKLGSDSVQDVSRLLRLPGFLNVKDFQGGATPATCRVVEYVAYRTYDFFDFQHFAVERNATGERFELRGAIRTIDLASLPKSRDLKRVRGLLRLLDADSEDRSKRDFFVVTKLLSLGCTPEEVAGLVARHSKFDGNKTYLERTIENAVRVVRSSG